MSRLRTFAIGVMVGSLIVAACVGKDDVTAAQEQYCNNVRAGIWPDYNKTFKEDCGGENPPKFNEDLTK